MDENLLTISGRGVVLVVDDTPEEVQLLYHTLKEEFDFYFASNGEGGVTMAQTRDPDLILLDVMLPDLDGYQVMKRLRQDPRTRDIPVIILTACTDEEDETRAFEAGAVDYIPKPIRPGVVRARTRTHMQLKRQRDFLAQLSAIDGLTGLFNRRRFDETWQREWRRFLRNKTPLSVILLDIDHFKLFNDQMGHLQGDECLRRVAWALNDTIRRPHDFLARYGGEEFVCILPETESSGARLMAEKMRQAVFSLEMPHSGSSWGRVTVSLGMATAMPGWDNLLAEKLLLHADEALYQAKNRGRNRLVSWGEKEKV